MVARPAEPRSQQQRDRFNQLGAMSRPGDDRRINPALPRVLPRRGLHHEPAPLAESDIAPPPECWFG